MNETIINVDCSIISVEFLAPEQGYKMMVKNFGDDYIFGIRLNMSQADLLRKALTLTETCQKCIQEVTTDKKQDDIRPSYYGGSNATYEAIKVIRAWDLDFELGNVVKYIARAGKKDPDKIIEDLKKARSYIDMEIERQNYLHGI